MNNSPDTATYCLSKVFKLNELDFKILWVSLCQLSIISIKGTWIKKCTVTLAWRLKALQWQHARQYLSAKNSPDPKLLTTKPQLQYWLTKEKYLNLIGRKESVASVTFADNQNHWPITAGDAGL